MKMKEVIEKTGLTDRAIRLYISNGLVNPACERTYTGRNHLDFSDIDVEQLQKIAVLRKADFSLGQIGILMRGDPDARQMLASFMEEKRLQVEKDCKVLAALEALPADADISVDVICEKIEEGLRERSVPEEDQKPSRKELTEIWGMRITAGLIGSIFFIFLCWLAVETCREFPFLRFYDEPWHYLGAAYLLLPVVLMLIILVMYRKPGNNPRRRIISFILLILTSISIMNPYGLFFLWGCPPVYSETEDPGDYMQLGICEQAEASWFCSLFPAAIPRSAISWDSNWHLPNKFPETTKYHYKHEHGIDPYYDIYAEWILPEKEYAAEKQRIQTGFGEYLTEQIQWGDWVCLNFEADSVEDAAELDSYDYLIFAYNDKTSTVRYIVSRSVDWGDMIDPYFLSLDW